jgi:hypothetical protein
MIPEEDYPAAFALWIAETTGGPVPEFEKVEREPPRSDLNPLAALPMPPEALFTIARPRSWLPPRHAPHGQRADQSS